MSAQLPLHSVMRMPFVVTQKGAISASASHHTSMLITPMIAYVRLNVIIMMVYPLLISSLQWELVQKLTILLVLSKVSYSTNIC